MENYQLLIGWVHPLLCHWFPHNWISHLFIYLFFRNSIFSSIFFFFFCITLPSLLFSLKLPWCTVVAQSILRNLYKIMVSLFKASFFMCGKMPLTSVLLAMYWAKRAVHYSNLIQCVCVPCATSIQLRWERSKQSSFPQLFSTSWLSPRNQVLQYMFHLNPVEDLLVFKCYFWSKITR